MLQRILIAAFVLAAVAGASAQQRPQTPPPAAAGEPPAWAGDVLPDGQLLIMFDSYAMFQAQQQLAISDDKFGSFAGRLKKLQDVRRRNQRMRNRLVQDLRRLAGPRSDTQDDEAAVRAQLVRLKEHDQKAADELRQAYEALDEVLDPWQQARFRVFEDQIEQRKLDLLLRARERARQNRQR